MDGPYNFGDSGAGGGHRSLPGGYSAAPRGDVNRDMLLGDDIRQAPVPAETWNDEAWLRFYNPQTRLGFGMSVDQLSKHLLLIGGIGSGKTNVFYFIIQQLMKRMAGTAAGRDDILIIFDTKGDFERRFYDRNNRSHILIGNSARYRGTTLHWNLFRELLFEGAMLQEVEVAAKELAMQLFRGRGSETQPFFAQAGTDLVSKAIIHFIRNYVRSHDASRLNNQALTAFFRSAGLQQYSELLQSPGNEDFRSAQMYIGNPGQALSGQALGVFGEINSMVNDLFVGIFSDGRGDGRDFAMRQLVHGKGGRVVFVEYDLSLGEVLGPIYRLLFDLALKEALGRRDEAEGRQGNVYLVIDEFKLLPDLMHIDNALNFGRSKGVKVFAGIQSINQLYDIYGEYRGKALAAGFMNSFCFQTWDAESRQYISERFGRNYSSLSYYVNGTPTNVQREGHTVEDWDILNLGIGQACVNLVGKRPFLYQFPIFRAT